MDVKYINPFVEALNIVLSECGVTNVKMGKLHKKESMKVDMEVTSVVGMVGDVRGNIAYSFSQDTAKVIVSGLMGRPLPVLDAMGRSGVGEVANMITGNASSKLAATGVNVNITPPSVFVGKDMNFIISTVDTIAIEMDTSAGKIEINVGLEI